MAGKSLKCHSTFCLVYHFAICRNANVSPFSFLNTSPQPSALALQPQRVLLPSFTTVAYAESEDSFSSLGGGEPLRCCNFIFRTSLHCKVDPQSNEFLHQLFFRIEMRRIQKLLGHVAVLERSSFLVLLALDLNCCHVSWKNSQWKQPNVCVVIEDLKRSLCENSLCERNWNYLICSFLKPIFFNKRHTKKEKLPH